MNQYRIKKSITSELAAYLLHHTLEKIAPKKEEVASAAVLQLLRQPLSLD